MAGAIRKRPVTSDVEKVQEPHPQNRKVRHPSMMASALSEEADIFFPIRF